MDILALFGALLLWACGTVANGFVLSVLWRWFMIPIFHVSELSILPAIYVALLTWFLNLHWCDDENHKQESVEKKNGVVLSIILIHLVKLLLILFAGWILHRYA